MTHSFWSYILFDLTTLQENSCMASIITFASYLLVFITLPISIWGCVKVIFKVAEYYLAKLEPTDHVLSLSAFSMPVSTGGSILWNTVKAKVENYKKMRWIDLHKTQVVQEYERAVIFRLGRYFDNILNWFSLLFLLKLFLKYKFCFYSELLWSIIFCRLRSGGAKGPGLFFVLPCIDTYR